MARSLRSLTERERNAAIMRRQREQTGGLGYWAAVDAERRRAAEKHAEKARESAHALERPA